MANPENIDFQSRRETFLEKCPSPCSGPVHGEYSFSSVVGCKSARRWLEVACDVFGCKVIVECLWCSLAAHSP